MYCLQYHPTLLQGNDQEIEATFLVADGDVTSDSRITPDNIEQKINRFYFEPFFSANEFYYPKDIIEVVQICDLDGTFIPENHCKEYDTDHSAEDGFIYDPPYIFGKSHICLMYLLFFGFYVIFSRSIIFMGVW